ncbi:TIGR02569 family protein [Amycolatopsis cihanbeyliensis]|uniref:Uncharacterized protein (TIGR02569 family) n=1 Tax=Amycolatopsis cihanbeyliensis TaxID=1128664 RepID=A0A542DP66_AMYCI|nr:TIGR02569 family protein [Amycolatopsis cihanbeyliensis]TQJ04888.1 uncharacterized protein (TIGR02569 family) [Amycolatopsis cihanbeyliensis]
MVPSAECPPEHVGTAFGVSLAGAEPLPDGRGWLCGQVVLSPVTDRARAVWLAGTLAAVGAAPDLRVARPVRATDGRWLVAGWRASQYVSGAPAHRPDDTVLAAVRLHQATVGLPRPDFLSRRTDISTEAERAAWGERELELDEHKGGRWFEVLAGARRQVPEPDQLVHRELFGTALFDGDASPGIVDFIPCYRPADWGAAVVAIDALAWGGADPGLLRRWTHLPHWPQLLLRAVLFRLAHHALDPRSTRESLDGLLGAVRQVSDLV